MTKKTAQMGPRRFYFRWGVARRRRLRRFSCCCLPQAAADRRNLK